MGIRAFAFIVDYLLLKFIAFPVLFFMTGISVGLENASMASLAENRWLVLFVFWGYTAAMEGALGASWGKLFVHMRIYNADGSKMTITKALLRFPLKIISIITIVGVFMIDIHKEKQALHDLICGTIVRRKRS